ncbi:hypothetical protein BH10PLA1_BH10PLA1_15730 [soil metagenome]
MSSENPIPPRPESKKVLSYAIPQTPAEPARRAFGNVWGNAAVGLAAFVGSCFVGPMIASDSGARSAWAYAALPCATLLLGIVAAFSPKYRGVLLGMLLILIGVPLLVLGICFMGK